jgi:hypothetical protein
MSEIPEPAPGPIGRNGVIESVRSFLRSGRGGRPAGSTSRRRRFLVRAAKASAVVVSLWLLAAYLILPALWRHYEHHPALEDAPKTSLTAQGIPGDPLNVGLIGAEHGLVRAMLGSGWNPADPVTMRTSLRIARSVLMDRSYADAPVSPLFVFGRKQDLAFEKTAGKSASHRHHVRFWKSDDLGRDGVPFWIGAVTFDRSVGLSHTTGQITHHIGPDIDAERDGLIGDLVEHGCLAELFQVTGVGATLLGRNGGGDRYSTDGELTVGVLAPGDKKDRGPERLANPVAVRVKQQLWTAIRPLLRTLPGQ